MELLGHDEMFVVCEGALEIYLTFARLENVRLG